MDATAAALLGAALGAITALAGAAITAYVALYNERQRRDEVERHAFTTALRAATADVFVQFYNFSHAMAWVTWFAKYAPPRLDAEMARSYEQDTHDCVPKLQGMLAVVASLSLPTYQKLQQLVQRLFVLDSRVSRALTALDEDRGSAVETLAGLFADVNAAQDQMPLELSTVMETAQLRKARADPRYDVRGSVTTIRDSSGGGVGRSPGRLPRPRVGSTADVGSRSSGAGQSTGCRLLRPHSHREGRRDLREACFPDPGPCRIWLTAKRSYTCSDRRSVL